MDKIIFFAILVLFPFGQLFKVGIFNAFDIAISLLAIVTIFKKPKYPEWYKYFVYFILFCVFGLIFNYQLFTVPGLLYLLRLFSYSLVAVYVSNFYQSKNLYTIYNVLLSVSVASAVFGWFQYIFFPDLTWMKYLGWDDHLLRMVGTFFDPAYLGLIIVLGIVLANYLGFKKIMYFLIFSLAFTYSRSSYLVAILFLFFKKKYLGILILCLSILVLPKMIGEGTNLTRTVSVNNKIINYKETLQIFKKSPVLGLGFNNICKARRLYLKDTNTYSHSCSGADSSILFLLATTGVMGTMMLLYAISHMPYGIILKASFLAVLIHSFFTNSIFYPHIMFWIFLLLGLKTKSNGQRSVGLVS